MTDLLQIVLPVCPTCKRVSPLPTANWAGKTLCSGPVEDSHKKVKMEPVRFREVRGEKKP